MRSPATYAVETWMKRSSAPCSCASSASLTTERVPSTLIRRASSIGSVKLIEAAQCTTAEISPAICSRASGDSPRPGDSRSAATARTRPSRGCSPGATSDVSISSTRACAASSSAARTSAITS